MKNNKELILDFMDSIDDTVLESNGKQDKPVEQDKKEYAQLLTLDITTDALMNIGDAIGIKALKNKYNANYKSKDINKLPLLKGLNPYDAKNYSTIEEVQSIARVALYEIVLLMHKYVGTSTDVIEGNEGAILTAINYCDLISRRRKNNMIKSFIKGKFNSISHVCNVYTHKVINNELYRIKQDVFTRLYYMQFENDDEGNCTYEIKDTRKDLNKLINKLNARQELKALQKKGKIDSIDIKILKRYANGFIDEAIARECNISRSTVTRRRNKLFKLLTTIYTYEEFKQLIIDLSNEIQ